MRETVINYLQQKGITVIDYDNRITEWEQWYKGDVKGFHDYTQWNGKKQVPYKRKSLYMAARVSQDWADLLLNERVELTVAAKNKTQSKKAQEKLDELLTNNNFYVRGNNLIETAFAVGGGYFVEYYNNGTKINYITQDNAFPISTDNGTVKECAFASELSLNGDEYIYINIHKLNDKNNYVIYNVFLNDDGKEVDGAFYKKNGIKDKWETHSDIPLFQQIKPNIVNRYDYSSPYGVSVFNTAIDAFKKCDSDFTAYYCEVALGKKRLFVKDGVTAVNFNEDNQPVRAFQDDDIYYSVPDDDNSPMITESNMTLRVSELEMALQNSLNLISQECGFGADGYKWDNGSVATATQIISENSKMFRTLQKHELILSSALCSMAKGLLFVENELSDNKVEYDVTVTVDFDDSIIEDTAEKKRQALQDYSARLISWAEYFRQVYNMDEKQSVEYVDKMAEEMKKEMTLLQIESEPMPE